MRLSIVVCTRNRASSLRNLLRSMCRLEAARETDLEIIVVDNGSTDETSSVVEEFDGSLHLRRIVEPVPGLSNARNAGVAAAMGHYILWTDDDVEVDPNWVTAYAESFVRHPDAVLFGGRIEPKLEPPTHDWFEANIGLLSDLVSKRDFGEVELRLDKSVVVPYGANFAIKTQTQRQFLYDAALGVAPGRRIGGEEIDVFERVLSAGGEGWYAPYARVTHVIPAERQTIEYVAKYYQACGELRSIQLMRRPEQQQAVYELLGLPFKMVVNFARYCSAKLVGDSQWVKHFIVLQYRKGILGSYFRLLMNRADSSLPL